MDLIICDTYAGPEKVARPTEFYPGAYDCRIIIWPGHDIAAVSSWIGEQSVQANLADWQRDEYVRRLVVDPVMAALSAVLLAPVRQEVAA